MSVLQTRIDRHGAEFVANEAVNRGLAAELRELAAKVRAGGSAAARAQHESRDKLLVRDRIDRLLDPGTPFLEIGQLAGHDLYDDWIPSGGVVAGSAGVGSRMRHRRQRRDGERRHVLPDHRAQAPARAGSGARESPALHLPGRLGRRVPADAGTTSSPTRNTSAASSTTRRRCRRAVFRSWRW